MLLCADADAAAGELASGVLACPSCGARRLWPWRRGRERVIRLRDGARARLSPLRGRCGSCQATHILLPSWMASRRADAVGVIAAAAVASALHSTGAARIGADLGVPAATVRGWLRRLRVRAGAIRQDATVIFGRLTEGCDAPFPEPSGSALGDTLSAVAACAHAAITFRGSAAADREPLLGLFGLARFLTPLPAADPARPARAPACPETARDAHREHPAASTPSAWASPRHYERYPPLRARNVRSGVLISSDATTLNLSDRQHLKSSARRAFALLALFPLWFFRDLRVTQ